MADKTIKLTAYFPELPPESMAILFSLTQKEGWLAFKESEVQEKDLPIEQVEFKGDKTPGQRLRAVLYKLWEQDNAGMKDFDLFYKTRMERLIEQIKQKLE